MVNLRISDRLPSPPPTTCTFIARCDMDQDSGPYFVILDGGANNERTWATSVVLYGRLMESVVAQTEQFKTRKQQGNSHVLNPQNRLSVGAKVLSFSNEIEDGKQLNSGTHVVLLNPMSVNDYLNNIYAVSEDGVKRWRIQHVSEV